MKFTLQPEIDADAMERLRGVLEASGYAHSVTVADGSLMFEARDADVLSAVRREIELAGMSER